MNTINRREVVTGSPIHCNCGGTGKYTIENEDGIVGSFSTHLCACRLNEPPREGDARWWTTEDVKEMRFERDYYFEKMTATIERERPVSEGNHRLIRTPENSYFPACATLDGEFSSVGLTSAGLRELADWLREVADEVDRIDAEIS